MLNSGQGMFLLVPSASNPRELRAGKVIESNRETFCVEFEEVLPLAVGMESLAYCDMRGKFFQQAVTLVETRESPQGNTHIFKRDSEPVSAEQRQTFRVSVAVSDIFAQLGHQQKVHVVDCSAEGLGVIGLSGYALGSVQKLELNWDQYSVSASARVQTIKTMPGGKVRYGLLVPNSNIAARNALQKITAAFQRNQLKRLAGAA